MRTPHFMIGGGVASGTSFLSKTLANHHNIFMPKKERPEPNCFHYFWKFEKGIAWYSEEYFSDYAGELMIGERSSLLFNSAVAPIRIRDTLEPDTKLIFVLRDPVERAWANYRFTSLEGLEHLDFETALKKEKIRIEEQTGKRSEIQPYAYLTRSLYAEAARLCQNMFSKSNILFLFLELMSKGPEKTIGAVYDFLNLEPPSKITFPVNYTSPSVLSNEKQVEMRNILAQTFLPSSNAYVWKLPLKIIK